MNEAVEAGTQLFKSKARHRQDGPDLVKALESGHLQGLLKRHLLAMLLLTVVPMAKSIAIFWHLMRMLVASIAASRQQRDKNRVKL